jgi:uncharacterized repeat protein (TIGR04052 family)
MRTTSLALMIAAALAACGGDEKPPREEFDGGLDASAPGDQRDAQATDGQVADAGEERMFVTIPFKAVVGSEPFACDRTYRGLGTSDVDVAPKDLRLFVQDVKLVRVSDGSEVALELDEREAVQRTDVTLLDFETNSGYCLGAGGNARTNTTVTGWVPKGQYRGLVFSNGVPVSVNHKNPTTLTAPLSEGPLHWNWTSGFLFIDVQLRELVAEDAGASGEHDAGTDAGSGEDEDAGADDAGPPVDKPGSMVLHIGSSACAPGGCSRSNRNRVALPDFEVGKSSVVLDVAKVVEHVNLSDVTACHVVGVSCPSFFPVLGIDGATGNAAATQAMYRLE